VPSLWELWTDEASRWTARTGASLPEVHFRIDQSAEAADARELRLRTALASTELGWTDLRAAGGESIPAACLLVTPLSAQSLCVRLVDLRGGAGRSRTLATGHYVGTIHSLDRSPPLPLGLVRVQLR
jgi:hypothetical protein